MQEFANSISQKAWDLAGRIFNAFSADVLLKSQSWQLFLPDHLGSCAHGPDAFAAGAVQPTIAPSSAPTQTVYNPWEKSYVREHVLKQVLLKMPEPLSLKLKHITNYTPCNMTSFIIRKDYPEIEKEIARMTGRG